MMKKRNLIYAVLMSVCGSMVMTTDIVAQNAPVLTQSESDRIDSLKGYDAEQLRVEELNDKENLSDLKAEKADTQLQAKEARRIERDANAAARESRIAYRSEKQAQKARKQADKQAKKASKARSISNDN